MFVRGSVDDDGVSGDEVEPNCGPSSFGERPRDVPSEEEEEAEMNSHPPARKRRHLGPE